VLRAVTSDEKQALGVRCRVPGVGGGTRDSGLEAPPLLAVKGKWHKQECRCYYGQFPQITAVLKKA
jgi:hypothetical protein